MRNLPFSTVLFFGVPNELILGDDGIVNVHWAIGRLREVFDNSNDSFANGTEVGRRERDVAAVVNDGCALRNVDNEAMQTPIQESASAHGRVSKGGILSGRGLEILKSVDFAFKDRQLVAFLVEDVAAELRRDESCHAGSNGGVNERILVTDECRC